jgi:bifunctional polynucleotide phosphatase/kinase
MNEKWIETENITFYNNISTSITHYKNVVIFDLDNTLIKTKSKRVFPINTDDWMFNFENIVDTLHTISKNTLLGIITNQKGIKSHTQLKEWQYKLNQILKYINFNFIFASFKDDRYRKPMIGSWDFIKEHLNGIKVPDCKIIFVGDACGRENDFSDTDIKFAMNCGFKFYTPEKFFKISLEKQIMTTTYPELEYYTTTEFNKILKNISLTIDKHINNNILIILIGLPSCGKSFIRKLIIDKYYTFKYFNKDDIHNKIDNDNLIKKHNDKIKFIIDDNTNMSVKNRNELYKTYNSYYKIGIYFDYDIDLVNHLNYMRMYWFGAELIKKVVYNTLYKKFDVPIEKEFDIFIKLNKIIPDFNLEKNLKYYF